MSEQKFFSALSPEDINVIEEAEAQLSAQSGQDVALVAYDVE